MTYQTDDDAEIIRIMAENADRIRNLRYSDNRADILAGMFEYWDQFGGSGLLLPISVCEREMIREIVQASLSGLAALVDLRDIEGIQFPGIIEKMQLAFGIVPDE